jgi:hypothetical protein
MSFAHKARIVKDIDKAKGIGKEIKDLLRWTL